MGDVIVIFIGYFGKSVIDNETSFIKGGDVHLLTLPITNPSTLFKAVDDEAVLLNGDTGMSLVLNRTGIVVWELMDGTRHIEDIVEIMQLRYPNAPASIYDDVKRLINDLAADGFVGYELIYMQ